MTTPTLAGAQVTLRALTESDVDALFRLFSDPTAMRYWSCPAYTERAQAEADIDPRNALSQCLGFIREGLWRERWCVAGEISDSALYGLLARDGEGRK